MRKAIYSSICLLFWIGLIVQPSPAQVIISEFMADNKNTLRDEDGDYPDWIELYNSGDKRVNLAGWYLTDDETNLGSGLNKNVNHRKWKFPRVHIPSSGRLLVFASNKNRANAGSALHTNFKLSAKGEYLALVFSDGTTVVSEFSPKFPVQRPDISYGIAPKDMVAKKSFTDVTPDYVYNLRPTPGQVNSGRVSRGFIKEVDFSRERGFYEKAFNLTLSCSTAGAKIRYTLDGSRPTRKMGILYTKPIRISRTTIVRALAFSKIWSSSKVRTHTFIFTDDVIKQPTMTTAITKHPAYKSQMKDSLLSLPSISLVTTLPINERREIKTSVEMLHPDGTEGFHVDAGIKVVGGTSVRYAKKSFRLFFRSKYGYSKLKYPLFEGHPYTSGAVDEFDQLQLRSGSHDSVFWLATNQIGDAQYLRNRWIHDTQLLMGQLSLHGRFVHLYINGVYWGQYNLMERPSRDFLFAYLGGKKEDYEVINSGRPASNSTLITWMKMKSLTGDYQTIQNYLDVENLIDYMLLNFYAGNTWDWRPNQNWMAGGPAALGKGGFKFFAWDSDVIFQHVNNNNASFAGPSGIFPRLLVHDEFRMLLADRIYKHFFNDGALTFAKVDEVYAHRAKEIYMSLIADTARWGRGWWTRDRQWKSELKRLRQRFFPRRTAIVIQQLRQAGYYPLDAPEFNQRGGMVPAGFKLRIASEKGKIYYTTDNIDPRLPGGRISPSAQEYNKAIKLNASTTIKTRVKFRGKWSAINEAEFVVGEKKEKGKR